MTLTRSRVIAALLCALLVIVAYLLTMAMDDPERRIERVPQGLSAVQMPAMPPMAPPVDSAPPVRFEADDSPRVAVPNVSPSAAPGVAFNYRYAFRLPPGRIAEVQEKHAELCERLTVARCRIAAMFYRLGEDGQVEARLELRLAPAIARRFGRNSVEMVNRADGLLAESEISGTDAAAAIRAAGRSLAELEGALAGIEEQLRQTRAGERPELDFQAQQLREQIQSLRDSRATAAESIATTPMLFQYAAGGVASAPAERPRLAEALDRSLGNLISGVGILLLIVVTLLPWVAAGLLGWLLVRAIRRRFPASAPDATA